VYAGCVYWPFHGHTTIGTVLVSIILVGGVIDSAYKAFIKSDRKKLTETT
jgi:hypothetical protein